MPHNRQSQPYPYPNYPHCHQPFDTGRGMWGMILYAAKMILARHVTQAEAGEQRLSIWKSTGFRLSPE
jgi:hypothetical protein